MASSSKRRTPHPPFRHLRLFAFDPILSRRVDTSAINEINIKLPWEEGLEPGPVDDYIEVVDYDPASQAFYAPVDLNDMLVLAQHGLPPSISSPQFHQQMVYAVARTTIGHFERALGRRALWAPRRANVGGAKRDDFVRRLRIYPHALREANAYYSPIKEALLFGYFPASTTAPGENLPGETVFACLSHDIVAHETSHALLDGLHRRFIEPSNVDVLALHEAFADIVALFQHFTYPDVLRHQIALTRGDLQRQNLLGGLAYQFGQAIGLYGALRSALGHFDSDSGEWIAEQPDPEKILRTTEPHARGAILVAAIFEAFLTIYEWRISRILRIASGGTGILPPGELHPDVVEELAQEAAKTASHILQMCIRALDYCPPVDVDFGDYLRALITADRDLVPDDRYHYRLAIIEAFRRRGIYPRDVRTMSEESLLWYQPRDEEQDAFRVVFRDSQRLCDLIPDWGLTTSRDKIHGQTNKSQALLHDWFVQSEARDAASIAGIILDKGAREALYRDKNGIPTLEVHSVRPARRVGPEGHTVTELVIEMTQRRRGYYDPDRQARADSGQRNPPEPDFIFRGGCTLLVDPDTGKVRYAICKRIASKNRLERMRRFLVESESPSARATYFGDPLRFYQKWLRAMSRGRGKEIDVEPLALLNRSFEQEEVK